MKGAFAHFLQGNRYTYIHTHTERERERERIIDQKRRKETNTHTYTHTERERERIIDQKRRKETDTHTYTHIDREREREMRYSFLFFSFSFFGFWVWKRRVMSGLEEKGFGFGREAICKYWKQKEEGNKNKRNFSFNAVYLVY